MYENNNNDCNWSQSGSDTINVKAGPIWNQADANKK